MQPLLFRGRRAVRLENDSISLTVTEEGGHLAELVDKRTGVSPLWVPDWPSVEPSAYSHTRFPEYGRMAESQLVAGLMGHSICLDLFGAPDEDEAAAGMPVHGEAPVATYTVREQGEGLAMEAGLPLGQMHFRRELQLGSGDGDGEGVVRIAERVTNLAATARPIGWTEHVTLGAPFLERGMTRFLLSADQSRVYERDFNAGLSRLLAGADFRWPHCPLKQGGTEDLSVMTAAASSSGFTAHRMTPQSDHAWFVAWSPRFRLAFGYVWRTLDFPWLARWEENESRPWAPWNGEGFALGMEFGVSPMVEGRRDMVARGAMFGTPCFRWLPALGTVEARYCAFVRASSNAPTGVLWDGEGRVVLM